MRTLRLTVLAASLASALATSPPSGGTTTVDGDVVLLNGTDVDLIVEVQPLRPSLVVDCEAVARDPSALDASFFGSPRELVLFPDETQPLRTDVFDVQDCFAFRVTLGSESAVVFWRSVDFFVRFHESPLENLSMAQPGTILVGVASQPFNDGGDGTVFPAESDLPRCDDAPGLSWDGPRDGTWMLGEPTQDASCTLFPLMRDTEAEELEICQANALLDAGHAFDAGDEVRLYHDAGAFRMSQEGRRELELILSIDPQRPPYAMPLQPGFARPTCLRPSGSLLELSLPVIANGFGGAVELEVGEPLEMDPTLDRAGWVMLQKNVELSVHLGTPSPPEFGIASLTWLAR